MLYSDGQKRIIEGMPYTYMAEIHAWRCDNSGRILSEAQVQEMQYMMYSEDGWDDPRLVVTDKENSSGSVSPPSRPRGYFRDYKKILVELWGRGGTGGVADEGATAGAGGGAGGYSYKLIDWRRATQTGITLAYTIADGVAEFTLGTVGGDTVFSVQPGTDGSTATPGVGGTAAGGDVNVFGGSGGDPTATAGGIGGTPYRSYFPINKEEYARYGGAGATETTVAGAAPFFGAGGGGGFSAEGFTSPAAGAAAHVRVTFI